MNLPHPHRPRHLQLHLTVHDPVVAVKEPLLSSFIRLPTRGLSYVRLQLVSQSD